ncbi:NAD(P)/FAD-dependent oxidoreductase [Aquabacter sediminis]|uniref:NAD(P)/FAD-dependent oxidoreductase n=1 Tax=Aquabacter sediminis TaxID=3029197 RepID=UPI00237E7A30|nr:NAD(P)/FAD-dependent oxidoreductase [Aquabacter sp. P-9]MDE1568864.1 NAD(P)/FAD-dependent oxidoreductase [Aquabacter sp. P-9]
MSHDLIVLGAGPAGGNAALSAAEAGLKVVLFDQQSDAGGQVWRAPLPGVSAPASPEAENGGALRARLAASAVDCRFGRTVWSVGGRFRVDAVGPAGNETVEAPRLIAATGAHERVVPFPGWTLPGVIGLAAATVLLKSHRALPGRRVVVAGCGPLLAVVAAGILKEGGEVAAIADLAGPQEWLRALPALATQPRLLARGAGWALKIGSARVPVLFRHGVRAAEGVEALARVRLAPLDHAGAFTSGTEQVLDVDGLCIGHGLVPGAEVTRLFRVEQGFDRRRGGFVPQLDEDGRTGLHGLYACGDGAGLRGALVAEAAGRLAGLAAAHDAGALSASAFATAAAGPRVALAKARAFSDAMADMMALRPAQVSAIPPDTVVCRCEDVTRAQIEAAHADGARDMNQLKHFTRCGMGPCQGRFCGDVAAELLAAKVGSREAVGSFTARPPLRPVALADLMGAFDYSDIPIPAPAPL